ncbi:MAG TPA: hypothetical protein VLE51_03770 [Candidatus Saccharimonadales bacterium]|nr:hypothetical protein [Candidatus Saccharimonadales bacterium]
MTHYVEILRSPPNQELTPKQKQAFVEFENGLMDGLVHMSTQGESDLKVQGARLPLNELEDQTSYSQDRAELSLDYFLTETGQGELIKLGLLEEQVLDKAEQARLIRAKALYIPKKSLKELQKASEDYVDQATIAAIAEGASIEDPERIVVFSDGTKLVRRAKSMWAYKNFFKQVSKELNLDKDPADNLIAAKKSIVKMYRKKVNGFLASVEPDLLDFWRQLETMDNETHRAILQETVSLIWPPIDRVDTDQESSTMKRFVVRLDRIRNGASLDERAKYSAVSQELENLFQGKNPPIQEESHQPIFSPEEISAMDNIVFDADQMQEFCKFLLGSVGKLSSESDETYDPDRPTRAKDGKWQVPIREDVKSMGADDPPGALAIPSDFERSLTKKTPPVGVIPGALHEIKHIFQNDNYRNNERGLKLGKLMKGKGYVVLREAGTLDVERQVQKRLFGRERPDNVQHLRAIKVLENGGSEIEAVKAFFNSYLASNPDAKKETAASAAVRGVKRTARRQGGFDSQALNYAESTLVFLSTQGLEDDIKNVIFGEGAFSLDDLAELHKFGLLDASPAEQFPLDRLIDLTAEYMRKILNQSVDK